MHDRTGISRLHVKTLFQEGSATPLTDGQLLERFATGNSDAAEVAFTALVERHGPMVLRTCRGILHDDHEAMDAFQATFLILVRKGRALWVRDSLGPWLHRVACRAASRARGEAAHRQRLHQQLCASGLERTRERQIDSSLVEAVHEELNQLPDRFRVPILLCDLEGRSCEEAARHLGCPIGTIGSRLARGREKLRGRLVRRGLAPLSGAIATAFARDSHADVLPVTLVESTARLGLCLAAGKAEVVMASAASIKLARNVLWSLRMVKLVSAVVVTTTLGFSSVLAWKLCAADQVLPAPQSAPDKVGEKQRLSVAADYPFLHDKERVKDALYVELGNMRPLVIDDKGARFQTREAVVYKDGTAKLWDPQKKDPVVPTLRHNRPIRELTFFDEANLLVTTSDDAIKVWDALTGELRKELTGQTIGPMWLSFAPDAKRFTTMATDRKSVTIWDATTLAPVSTLRPANTDRIGALGLSGDGHTVAMFRFGTHASVELNDVESGQVFASLRLPSRSAVEVFDKDGAGLNKANLQRESRFWHLVKSLAPEHERRN